MKKSQYFPLLPKYCLEALMRALTGCSSPLPISYQEKTQELNRTIFTALRAVSPAVWGGVGGTLQKNQLSLHKPGNCGRSRATSASGPSRAHPAAGCAERGARRKLRRAAHSAVGPPPPHPALLRRNHCAPRGPCCAAPARPAPLRAPPGAAPRLAPRRPAQQRGGARAPCPLRASPLRLGIRSLPPSFWAVVEAGGRWGGLGWAGEAGGGQ